MMARGRGERGSTPAMRVSAVDVWLWKDGWSLQKKKKKVHATLLQAARLSSSSQLAAGVQAEDAERW